MPKIVNVGTLWGFENLICWAISLACFENEQKKSFWLRTATTHIKRQLISGDNSYQFEKATTYIKRQLVSIKTHIRKSVYT